MHRSSQEPQQRPGTPHPHLAHPAATHLCLHGRRTAVAGWEEPPPPAPLKVVRSWPPRQAWLIARWWEGSAWGPRDGGAARAARQGHCLFCPLSRSPPCGPEGAVPVLGRGPGRGHRCRQAAPPAARRCMQGAPPQAWTRVFTGHRTQERRSLALPTLGHHSLCP